MSLNEPKTKMSLNDPIWAQNKATWAQMSNPK